MTTLVTGGAGYIGSHFVKALREHDRPVVVLDTLERGDRRSVGTSPLVVGDIADQKLVRQICADYGVKDVVHFAAYKAVGESMERPTMYWNNNVHGSTLLIEALQEADVTRLVFSSSCSVYGNPTRVPVDETERIAPESVYAETKAMIERVLHWSSETAALRSVSLRYFNAAGAARDGSIGEDWTTCFNLIPLVMKAILGKRPPLDLFGNDYPTPDGTTIRDYVHVDDLAAAHINALDYLADGGATTAINVGTGVGSSVLDVITAAERISGHRVPYTVSPRRPGDPVESYADPSVAAEVLGWRATQSLDDIVESAWRWHSTHPDGYDS